MEEIKEKIEFDHEFIDEIWDITILDSSDWDNCIKCGEDKNYNYFLCWDNIIIIGGKLEIAYYRKKKVMSLNKSIDKKTYNVDISCWNCKNTGLYKLEKGKTIEDFRDNNICEKCGCFLNGNAKS